MRESTYLGLQWHAQLLRRYSINNKEKMGLPLFSINEVVHPSFEILFFLACGILNFYRMWFNFLSFSNPILEDFRFRFWSIVLVPFFKKKHWKCRPWLMLPKRLELMLFLMDVLGKGMIRHASEFTSSSSDSHLFLALLVLSFFFVAGPI